MNIEINGITIPIATVVGACSVIRYFWSILNLPIRDNKIPSGYRDWSSKRFISKNKGRVAMLSAIVGGLTFIFGLMGYSLWSNLVNFVFSITLGGWIDVIIAILALIFSNPK